MDSLGDKSSDGIFFESDSVGLKKIKRNNSVCLVFKGEDSHAPKQPPPGGIELAAFLLIPKYVSPQA
jgi:hypothetical protein